MFILFIIILTMATKIRSLKQKLRDVDAAIAEVEKSGQSISLDDGISYTRATLSRLYERQGKLTRAISRQEGNRSMFRRVGIGSGY